MYRSMGTMRHTSVWQRLWEQLRESTEGPTVNLQIPRAVADELLAMLSTSLEVDDDAGGEPDADDFGGPPDGDEDDDGIEGFSMGDDDDVPDFAAGDDSDDDDDDDGPDDDSDDDDDETDEAADYAHSGGNPSGMRTQTALGEKHIGFKKLKGELSHERGVRDPGALAASIGRKKYGAKGMAAKSAAGRRK
jgi:hypothetical protein